LVQLTHEYVNLKEVCNSLIEDQRNQCFTSKTIEQSQRTLIQRANVEKVSIATSTDSLMIAESLKVYELPEKRSDRTAELELLAAKLEKKIK